MNIFEFLIQFLVVNYVYGFVSAALLILPAAVLFALIKIDHAMKPVKVIAAYFLVAASAMLTLVAWGKEPSAFALISYPLLTAFLLLLSYSRNLREAHRNELQRLDGFEQLKYQMEIERDKPFETCLMWGSVLVYFLCLCVPALATNIVTTSFFHVVHWVDNLPVFGWLVRGLAIFNLVGMAMEMLFISALMFSIMTNRKKRNMPSDAGDAYTDIEPVDADVHESVVGGAVGRR